MGTEGRVQGVKGVRVRRRAVFLGLATAVAVVGAGCGAPMVARQGQAADVRGAASLRRNQPQMLMAGPGWLLHVNNERRGGLHGFVVYRVQKRQGTAEDCGAVGAALPAGAEPIEAPGRASLYVRANELVCAASPKRTGVSWHAQPLTEPDALKEAVASLR
jgi:hypothetical protein